MGKRVLAAMSGGVDSSVSAALLKEQGYEVIGAMMRFWPDNKKDDCFETCCSPDAAYEARRVADIIGIPFYLLDYREEFQEKIINPFIAGYQAGETPNPCVSCNTRVKFDSLLKKARMLGCDYVATGHYVINRDGGLYRGDPKKDQTYFLWGTPKEAIPHMLFPVGHLEKPQVRALAEKYGLPTAKKPESQNICFVQGDLKDFLAQHLTARPGPLIDLETGRQIGEHSGAQFYTVGQKKGLGLWKSHLERYVVQVNATTNEVIVGPREACMWGGLEVHQVNLLVEAQNLPERLEVQVRYRTRPVPAWVEAMEAGRMVIRLEEPQFAVTPGQSAVFYQGERLLGGGFIARALYNQFQPRALAASQRP
ncbi:tRNA 2-thiouridine(34) synthase MnmA [Meiothermus taiwanensis]|jgi:tRNA-specific 2-thiouridylase|uniref:tRNA-specific 2-thiouridylase MnmA n=2 Tax=Meiothermus taiwanensis TaxID=172827 RepID=A0A399E789_9DEIN|nr:tRNA 2-thiouridine(34) synthase MnmA [Meiothermus taiwanensis]AWR85819.1 tRNA(5-methylaminomethyl-2-thiouridylate)-methyl transferase [Meiothermus taiwanensis WR-220]KIQ55382.1 thiouridylase [Meiothermus taiwanensis]KZK16644.1 tRNA 2-thiouridine(34) synthase MnmA [Meiothermus taiwanensis]RIH79788.1 tRNA-specific 2-thiouridylase MnmA [Meiothermus taiwanensis]